MYQTLSVNQSFPNTNLGYDAVGDLLTQTDPLGNVTRFRYDVSRQLVGIVGPDPDAGGALHNRAVRLTYECDSSVKSGCDGLVTLAEQGTVLSQSDADWAGFVSLAQASVSYDGIDRATLKKASSGSTFISVTQMSYDTANRQTCAAVRMNPAAIGSLPTSACTLGTAGTAGPDRITASAYDNADRLLTLTSGYGTSLAANDAVYTYGADNELSTQADGKGHLTTIVRDTFNRAYQIQFPNPSNGNASSTTDYEQYTYDNNGNVTQNRRRDGTLVNVGYDALNLPTSGYNGASFGYDNLGRLTSASVAGQTLSFGYNALSQQTSETSALGTVARQFFLDGARKQLTYPDGYYVTYAYDAARELTSITDSSAVTLMSIGYDNLGRVSSVTRAQGASESLGYGSDLRLASLAYAFADTSKSTTFNYTYNLAGQPLTATATNASYRWTSARVAASYASDGQNRYTTVGANTLTYDGRSNVTSTGMQSFGYDGLNRLTSTGSTTLSYDAQGRLNQVVGSATTRLLYDGQQIIAEYNSAGALQRRFVPGGNLDQPLVWFEGTGTASGTARWLLPNAFGSIVAVGSSGASNTTLGINTYDEFGVSGTSNIGRFQYKGMAYFSETGLYHARARVYSQYLGRFLQPDPVGYADGGNLYAFAHNSPINSSDPTGLDTECEGTVENGGTTCVNSPDPGLGTPTSPSDPNDTLPDVGCGIATFGPCYSLDSNPYPPAPFDTPPSPFSPTPGLVACLQSVLFCQPRSQPAQRQKPNKVSCSSVLPNGQTVGQVVNQGVSQLQSIVDQGKL